MVSTVQNTDVRQKDAERAVVVAVTASAVFECAADDDDDDDDDDEVYGVGAASPLLQALQRVNDRLLEKNPAESLLFDVVLFTTNSQQQQQSSRIISSTRHYGLEVSRFCFSGEDDFMESLLKNNVQLFLSTDSNEALQASQRGVLSALLDQQTSSCPSEQLRVLYCGDTISQPDTGPTSGFSARLGEMRRKFDLFDSPLSIILVTSHGGRESCGGALRTLRSRGVSVDEAYCLAGAPQGPIMSVLQSHFMLNDGFCQTEE